MSLKKVLSFCLLLTCCAAYAQQEDYYVPVVETSPFQIDTLQTLDPLDSSGLLKKDEKQNNFSLSTGISFMALGNGNNGTISYIAPSYTWQTSEKFSITAGAILFQGTGMLGSQNNSLDPWTNYQMGGFSGSGSLLYAAGTYQINSKLRVSGLVYGNTDSFSTFDAYNNRGVRGGAIDLEYKIGEKTTIGLGFSIQQGNQMTPFGMQGFNTFGNGMFGQPQRFGSW